MGARMSVYDAAGNLQPYHYPYNFIHKVGQLPCRFFLAKCMYTRRVVFMAGIGIFPMIIFQAKVRSKENKETWRKTRAHYDHRFFRPPVMPHQSF